MTKTRAIAVVGTFDSKGEEHLFLKERIEVRGIPTLTINVGTKNPSPFPADYDLYEQVVADKGVTPPSRDKAIQTVIDQAKGLIKETAQEWRDMWNHFSRGRHRDPYRYQYYAYAPLGDT